MKRLLFIISIFAFCFTTKGQQVYQMQNRLRGDDATVREQVQANGFDLQGKNKVWSLADMDLPSKTFKTEYTNTGDTLTGLERGNRTYFLQTDKGISIIGTENYMEQISYDMPETWLQFPMEQGDSVCGYFNGTGKYCDRLFMRRFGTYRTKADATGKLVLPDGDTLRNVLRLHTERYVGSITAPIDTMKYKIPAFTTDSIIRHMATDTTLIKEDIYRWYADGYRYPVLEATIVSRNKQQLSGEIFYYAPEEQELLVLDEEHKKTRERLAATGTEKEDGIDSGDADERDFTYHVSQDEGSETINISYSSEQPGKVTALLVNSQGYVFRQTSQSDGSPLRLSYSGLRTGQYIIGINTGTHQFAEKFNVK